MLTELETFFVWGIQKHSSEHGGRRVGELFIRAQSIDGFSTDGLLDASNEGI